MTVFVLLGGFNYKGADVLGVYATQDEARAAATDHKQERQGNRSIGCDYYVVTRCDVSGAVHDTTEVSP